MARDPNCYGRAAISVLRERPDFRRAYLANTVSGLGESFQFVAVTRYAVVGLPAMFVAGGIVCAATGTASVPAVVSATRSAVAAAPAR